MPLYNVKMYVMNEMLSAWECHNLLNIKPSSFSILTTRFYSHVEGHEPAVLIVKTMDEEVESSDLSN